jgi:hypothetical protein
MGSSWPRSRGTVPLKTGLTYFNLYIQYTVEHEKKLNVSAEPALAIFLRVSRINYNAAENNAALALTMHCTV